MIESAGMHIYIQLTPFASTMQEEGKVGRRGGRGEAAAETGAESFELRLYPVFNKLSASGAWSTPNFVDIYRIS